MKNFFAVIGALALSSAAFAEEKKVAESEVPKPVIQKVKKKYPTAKMTGFEMETEGGKSSYQVKIADGSKEMEVVCSPDGKIVAEEEKIGIEAVPEKVRQALKSNAKYGSWTVHHAERVILDEKTDAPTYEIKVVKGTTGAELVFTTEGKLTKTEEKEWHEKKK
jgi:hypothetical protein